MLPTPDAERRAALAALLALPDEDGLTRGHRPVQQGTDKRYEFAKLVGAVFIQGHLLAGGRT